MSKVSDQWKMARVQWGDWRVANPVQALWVYAIVAVIVAFLLGAIIF